MTAIRQPLGQLMLRKGLVKQEQIDRALDEQRRGGNQQLLGELLVEMKCCTEDQVVEALALADGVPFVRPSSKLVDRRIVALLPAALLEKNIVLPMFLVEGCLTVAVSDPTNIFLLEELQRLTGHKVQPVSATAHEILATLQAVLRNEPVPGIEGVSDEPFGEDITLAPRQDGTAAKMPQAAPAIARLASQCILGAIKAGATGIHIETRQRELRVRYRIDGRLTERIRPPAHAGAALVSYFKAIAGADGAAAVIANGKAVELRMTAMPARDGEVLVIHVSDHAPLPANLEKLGLGYETLKQWRRLARLPSGLLLISAPAGSGKSATISATAADLNSAEVSICAIEESLTHSINGVNQFQVDPSAGIPGALRRVLSLDPDVITICDIPDVDSAGLAAQGALSGHLTIAAIRAHDAPAGIARLAHLGIEPHLIGATIAGVLSSALARKLCPRCKEPVSPTASQRRQIEKIGAETDVLYKPRGCDHCRDLGFLGRIGIFELLVPDEPMLERINAGASRSEIRELARAAGMRTIRDDGIEKVNAGITTLEEVHRVSA